jgi:hypothetical protein
LRRHGRVDDVDEAVGVLQIHHLGTV